MQALQSRLDLPGLEIHEKREHRTEAGARLDEYYDDRCEALVRDIYAHDFQQLDYATSPPG